MSEAQTVATTIHEMAHQRLHDPTTKGWKALKDIDENTREVQAESVAYTVCKYFGIDASAYSNFSYIAGWSSGKDTKELKNSLETIRDTSSEMIDSIEDNFIRSLEDRGLLTDSEIKTINSTKTNTKDFKEKRSKESIVKKLKKAPENQKNEAQDRVIRNIDR